MDRLELKAAAALTAKHPPPAFIDLLTSKIIKFKAGDSSGVKDVRIVDMNFGGKRRNSGFLFCAFEFAVNSGIKLNPLLIR